MNIEDAKKLESFWLSIYICYNEKLSISYDVK